jgi:hypothetical protein
LALAGNLYLNKILVKNLVIPEGIAQIKDEAFSGCTSITSVTIPSGVTRIGTAAFSSCSKLSSVTIGSTVESIGANAFDSCTQLSSITFSTDSLKSIGMSAFKSCGSLARLVIPNSVTSIGEGAFAGCSNLNELHIPFIGDSKDSTTSNHFGYIFGARGYGDHYGQVPTSLKTVVINEGTTIAPRAFYECKSIETVSLPEKLESIGDYAFYCCDALKSMRIPDKVETIGSTAFCGCTKLETVTIGPAVTTIGINAFDGCYKLNTVYYNAKNCILGSADGSTYNRSPFTGGGRDSGGFEVYFGVTVEVIPDYLFKFYKSGETEVLVYLNAVHFVTPSKVTTIGTSAFEGCSNITSITIPSTVSTIGNNAFVGTNIKTMHIEDIAAWCARSRGDGYDLPTVNAELYLNGKLLTELVIPEGVTAIADEAFDGCGSLKKVVIPSTVKAIGVGAFAFCPNLETVEIGANVETIGSSAFDCCGALKDVKFKGNQLHTINNGAFEHCNSLTQISIPDNVSIIKSVAFAYCSKLASIELPNNLEYLGDGVFEGCSALVPSYNYHEYAAYLGNEDNPYMILMGIPETMISRCEIHPDTKCISDKAFMSCTELQSLTIPAGVSTICKEAFLGCTSLYTVNFMLDSDGESSLKTIGQQAFADCTNLKCIVLPDSVEVLRYGVFLGCDNLTLCFSENVDTTNWYNNWNYGFNGTVIDNYRASEGLEYNMIDEYTCEVKSIGTCTDSDLVIPTVHEGALVTGIGQYAFEGSSEIVTIVIPLSVRYIGAEAFYNCSELESVTIPSSVTNIADQAFQDCFNLSNVVIEKGVTVIGKFAFASCPVTTLEIPNSVHAIKDEAFSYCTSLTKVTIPTSVKTMGSKVFDGCSAETKIHLGWTKPVYIPSGWNANWNPVPCKEVYTRPPKRY